MTSRFSALGAEIFAGGFTLGVHRAGFEILAQLESTGYGAKAAEASLPRYGVHAHILTDAKWVSECWFDAKDVDFLYANPPCAAWSSYRSTVGGFVRFSEHPGFACHQRVHKLVDAVRPRVWALESVPNILSGNAGGTQYVTELIRWAEDRGYAPSIIKLDGRFTGLPHRRRRVFLVFSRVAFWPVTPKGRITSVHDALMNVQDPGYTWPMFQGWEEVLQTLKPGQRLRPAFRAMAPRPEMRRVIRLSDVVLDEGLPAPIIVGYTPPNFIRRLWFEGHPPEFRGHYEHRFIGLKELAVLAGYPEDYAFGRPNETPDLIARGVMPPVAAWLAQQVHNALEDNCMLPPNWEVPRYHEFLGKTKELDDNVCVEKRGFWTADGPNYTG